MAHFKILYAEGFKQCYRKKLSRLAESVAGIRPRYLPDTGVEHYRSASLWTVTFAI
jgi:hypothetical protein